MTTSGDTIFALATGSGRAGVAIIRLSGPASSAAAMALGAPEVPPRLAQRIQLRHPISGDLLDDGLILRFAAPASYTGEDVVELHIHGGLAGVAAVLEALSATGLVRPARAGEFTRRAFENSKMDLTEVEGLADLIDAETSAQHRQALRQMEGALGAVYHGWADRLLKALAHLEAVIDFPDEDLPEDVEKRLWAGVAALADEISTHLADNRRGERLRNGVHVAIIGPPNAGKSTLLNALARREAAIVSDIAGTTRDVIDVHLDLGGYPVVLADTAGLRETADVVEGEGVRRSRARAKSADLRLALFDGGVYPALDPATLALCTPDTVRVINKADLLSAGRRDETALFLSVKTGEGMDVLLDTLQARVSALIGRSEAPVLTRARHRESLTRALECLKRAPTAMLPELAAEDLRLAVAALGEITGRVGVEDVLDVLFSDFCIGK